MIEQRHGITIGILGCANVAQKQAIPALKAIPIIDRIIIASRDYSKAQKCALTFGIEAEQSYQTIIDRPDIDAIYIPLPIGLHQEWVIKAARAGKHIICEKSLADSLAAVKGMVEACKSKGVILVENFMCDYHPQHQKVLSMLQSGDIGNPFLLRASFGFPPFPESSFRYNKVLGGGSLNDAGAYTLFMARKMFAAEPLAVTSTLTFDAHKQVDIAGSAMLEFPEQKVAQVAFSFDAMYQNKYHLWGTKGMIKVDRAYSIPADMAPPIRLIINTNFKEETTSIEVAPANQFIMILRDFCNLVLKLRTKGNGTIDSKNIDYSSLLLQATVLEAIRISAKENRKVLLKEIKSD